MQPMISILSLWLNDPTIFDGMQIPESLEKQRQNIIDMILAECGELNVLYSSPTFCKGMITCWSALNLPTWQRMIRAFEEEYNPIINYTRKETETEGTRKEKESTVTTKATSDSTDTSKLKKNAFNSGGQAQANQNESHATITNDNTTSGNEQGEDTRELERIISGASGTDKIQDLIKAEYGVARMNVANIIVADFKDKFCIQVY